MKRAAGDHRQKKYMMVVMAVLVILYWAAFSAKSESRIEDRLETADRREGQAVEGLQNSYQDHVEKEEEHVVKAVVVPPKKRSKNTLGKMVLTVNGQLETVEFELWPDVAPFTTSNFVALIKKGFYEDVYFYRAEAGFVLQGGGRTSDGKTKRSPYGPIRLEAKHTNSRRTLSMARQTNVNSASTEFFINLGDNTQLDAVGDKPSGYAVFGTITEGMDVIDSIADMPTRKRGNIRMLQEPVRINYIKMTY